jgi:serine/threonine protein kinase
MTAWIFEDRTCECDRDKDKDKGEGVKLDNRYLLLDQLGEGGAGCVYKAKDLIEQKDVAIKLIHPELLKSEHAILRVKKEVEISSEFQHPNLASVYGYGVDRNGQFYLIMELVNGQTLQSLLRQQKILDPKRAINLLIQIAEGLSYAHSRHVIHRDLKPGNIIVGSKEPLFLKIVDFGFAKDVEPNKEKLDITQSGEVFGSPLYMSPEQCLGQKLDYRTDIYSFGCIMYEMFAGEPPLIGENVLATVAKQVSEEPRILNSLNPNVTKQIEGVTHKCLAKDPLMRYQTISQLLVDLKKIKDGKLASIHIPKAHKGSQTISTSKLRSNDSIDWKMVGAVVVSTLFMVLLVFSFNNYVTRSKSDSSRKIAPTEPVAPPIKTVSPQKVEREKETTHSPVTKSTSKTRSQTQRPTHTRQSIPASRKPSSAPVQSGVWDEMERMRKFK